MIGALELENDFACPNASLVTPQAEAPTGLTGCKTGAHKSVPSACQGTYTHEQMQFSNPTSNGAKRARWPQNCAHSHCPVSRHLDTQSERQDMMGKVQSSVTQRQHV